MEQDRLYGLLCKKSFSIVSAVAGKEKVDSYAKKYASLDLVSSIGFTGMDVTPAEVISLSFMAALTSFIIVSSTGVIAVAYGLLDNLTAVLVVVCGGAMPLLSYVYAAEHPKRRASYMKVHSLGDVPEVVSYIVMSMKLNPNMERALKFTAASSKRQLARDVRKMMWDLQLRAYDSMDDALTGFAGNWGRYSDHFKRAVFIIKSSTGEKEEAMRIIALNRALEVVLAGTRSLMSTFSSSLHSPTLILYSIFVMVPLALVAMLPAASVIGLRINVLEMALTYDMLFPLVTLLYAHSILLKRPAAFAPPEIPESGIPAGMRKSMWAVLSLMAGVTVSTPYFIIPQCLLPLPNTIFPVWGLTAAVSIYCIGVYGPYKKVRDEIIAMENDFADSLFILGRRISEGRSPEDGFEYTARAVKGTAIGTAYARASFNIRCLRSTLYDAVLDPEHGAFSSVYSGRIRATIGMLVESSGKSGDVAGNSVIRLADHLKELQSIEDEIRKMLNTMTGMLKATCIIFAPFIGGVTLALSDSISKVIEQTVLDLQGMPDSARPYFPMVPEFSAPAVTPDQFVLVVGVYVIMLVIILLRFVCGIEHGDDRYEFMYSTGITLPVSTLVFTVTTKLSGMAFNGMF